ncbi:MAG: hypothetical protein ACI3ZQ_00900 [Candidatus Cryptobacteroides sp.]
MENKITRRAALKRMQFRKSEDGSFPDGSEINPDARYRNEHISLNDIKLSNNQKD